VRINTLKTTLTKELSSTFAGYAEAEELGQIMIAPASSKTFFVDPHIPNLVALPPRIDLSKSNAYTTGRIIFQDKASCFPAYLLNPRPEDGDIIDGCAAPGNKTTHSAAILSEQLSKAEREAMTHRVIAFERDKFRTKTLEKMVKLASADRIVTIKGGRDFLDARPDAEDFANVGSILLDPSCSGSGIVGRDDAITMHLPDPQLSASANAKSATKKKRKRNGKEKLEPQSKAILQMDLDDTEAEEVPVEDKLTERLHALSAFQLRILTHAMKFPKARKITYSTCSAHFEENEGVVFQALGSPEARQHGWTILKRGDQVSGLQKWPRRGVWEDGKLSEEVNAPHGRKEEILDACIRCNKATEDGTMGFFVAAFVRDESALQELSSRCSDADTSEQVEDTEEWQGFSEEETSEPTEEVVLEAKKSTHVSKK
jgi:putative methyltransferase